MKYFDTKQVTLSQGPVDVGICRMQRVEVEKTQVS